jgi:hypothetical protein
VNIGAAGTFVARHCGSRAEFRAALARALPFDALIVICDGAAVAKLASTPVTAGRAASTRFVSVLPRAPRRKPKLPISIAADGAWLVRVLAVRGQFVLGVYRRNMKTISALSKLDALFGTPLTTRSWSTIEAIARVVAESR